MAGFWGVSRAIEPLDSNGLIWKYQQGKKAQWCSG